MKIYKVAHENIVCPKEYRKIEIMEQDIEGYIKRSVAYQDMLETCQIWAVSDQWKKSFMWIIFQRSGYIAKCKNSISNVITILEILI